MLLLLLQVQGPQFKNRWPTRLRMGVTSWEGAEQDCKGYVASTLLALFLYKGGRSVTWQSWTAARGLRFHFFCACNVSGKKRDPVCCGEWIGKEKAVLEPVGECRRSSGRRCLDGVEEQGKGRASRFGSFRGEKRLSMVTGLSCLRGTHQVPRLRPRHSGEP